MIQAAPGPAVILYGGARLMLQLAQELASYQDTIAEILADMGVLLQGYELFSTAHECSQAMNKALVLAYSSIIRFWYQAAELLDRGSKKFRMIMSSVIVKPLKKQWDTCKRILEEQRSKITFLDQAIQSEMKHEQVLVKAAQDKAKLRSQIATWIKGDDNDTDLHGQIIVHYLAKKHHNNTCRWFFDHPDYKTWLESKTSSSLLVIGPPAAGKSVLASVVAQELEKQKLRVTPFFCSFSDPMKSRPLTILRALAVGLFAYHDEPPPRVLQMFHSERASFRSRVIDKGTAVKVLEALLEQIPRVHIILDGLDECSDTRSMLEALSSIMKAPAYGIVKWVFTTCPEHNFQEKLACLGAVEIAAPLNIIQNDIRSYIKDGLSKPCCDHCIDRLISRSEGNFLWAQFILQTLNMTGLTCEEDIDEKLNKFPRDLTGCYMRTLQHLTQRTETEQWLTRNAFTFIVDTTQPLRLSELRHALAAAKASKDFLTKRNYSALTIKKLTSDNLFSSTRPSPAPQRIPCSVFII